MKAVVCGTTLGLVALSLAGCGGGGGGGGPSPTPAPAAPTAAPTTSGPTAAPTPGPPVPPPSPPPCTGDCQDIKVLSYNLEWHSTQGGPNIVKTINANGPFDLLGMQECENINVFLSQIGNGHYEGFQVQKEGNPNYPGCKHHTQYGNQGDICMAWNTDVFEKESQGQTGVGTDSWACRMMQWAVLKIKGTQNRVFFANTHGPVSQCIGNAEDWKNVADNYIQNTKGQMKEGDHLFFTGDFNCGGTPIVKHDPMGHGMDDIIKKMREDLTDVAAASFFYPALFQPDRIWTLKGSDTETVDFAAVCCGGAGDCKPTKMIYDQPDDPSQPRCVAVPSDHMLLRGHFKVPTKKGVFLNSTAQVV